MSTPRTAAAILAGLGQAPDASPRPTVFPTGFSPLDDVLGGGLHAHQLTLIGGAPGAGKTIAALQVAGSVAASGASCVYACYEHDEADLILRLLTAELGAVAGPEDGATLDKLRLALGEAAAGHRSLDDVPDQRGLLAAARARLDGYAERLWLVGASGRHTGLAELEALVADQAAAGPTALFVDYLQKVAVRPEPDSETDKVTRIAEGLKELALRRDVAVVAVVAADRASLGARRLRLHHLRGSSALAYESDVVVLFNDKFSCVSKVHLAYDTRRAESYRKQVVWSVEKNRSGEADIDLEFGKDFASYRFDPVGGHVAERLIDERFDDE